MASPAAMALARTAARAQLRFASTAPQSAFRSALRQQTQQARFRPQQGQKRFASTGTAAPADPSASIWKRMWDSPVGFKTVHFWAPVMKWCIVIAGIADFARPAEKLSLTQNLALTATGLIWTRWCLIIKPKNILLAAVNFFLGMVGIVQISRIALYNQSQKKASPVEKAAGEVKESVVAAKEAIKQ